VDALSLRGFLTIAALAALPTGVAIGGYCAVTGVLGPGEAALVVLGSVVGGFLVAGVVYLVQLARELRTLHLPPEELLDSEAVVMQTPGSIVHYRTGRMSRVWDAVGGKLVLTNRRLFFLAHRGQPWRYRVVVPLGEVAAVASSLEAGTFPGLLQVTTTQGKEETFTFGAVRELEADRWAAAILQARYRAEDLT
jgi:hypothetical protein